MPKTNDITEVFRDSLRYPLMVKNLEKSKMNDNNQL